MKLGNILKKELKELLTFQTIFSMIFVFLLYAFMGKAMGGAINDAVSNASGAAVNILDLDGSGFTQKMLDELPDFGSVPELITVESDDYFSEMKRLEIENLLVIPEGFGKAAENGEEAEIKLITLMDKGGFASTINGAVSSGAASSVAGYVRYYFQTEKLALSEEEQKFIQSPLVTAEYVAANGRTVKAPADTLFSVMMNQSIFAPIAVFFLLLMAAQMIMTAISTEKIDKTLETLMSAPVSRITVLTAKMIAALAVALLNAGVMLAGMGIYINDMMSGDMMTSNTSLVSVDMDMTGDIAGATEAISALGLTLTGGELVIFGIQIFLSIAIGLSISLILGAMATDVKSVQTLIMPIMMLTMIPFMVTMFTDVNSLAMPVRILMYIIPFTHTYTAMTNMIFGKMAIVWAGLAYQAVFFVICMYLAVKMFTSDLLFTMNFSPESFGKTKVKKKKAKKSAQS